MLYKWYTLMIITSCVATFGPIRGLAQCHVIICSLVHWGTEVVRLSLLELDFTTALLFSRDVGWVVTMITLFELF